MAQREGFEPPETFISTVFKTAAIDRSAISAFFFTDLSYHFFAFLSNKFAACIAFIVQMFYNT